MEKVIFNGEINGVKFDTIEAYNAEIYRLKAEGCDNIVANASTQIINTPDECNCECNCDSNTCNCGQPECENSTRIPLLPGFEGNVHYLDANVGECRDTNKMNLDVVKAQLEMYRPHILSFIRSTNKDELVNYQRDIETVIASIQADRNDTSDAYIRLSGQIEDNKRQIAALTTENDGLMKRMEVLNDCHPLMDTYQEFYENLCAAVIDALNADNTVKPLTERAARSTKDFLDWIFGK
jgi:hypothetical protein